jgi:bacterioferritin-associated ferredoxin
MYICVCKGITEEQLEKAIKPGSKPGDVLKDLGVGDSCGICLLDAIEKMTKSNSNQSKSSKSK